MAPTSTMAAEIAEQPAAVARTLDALRPLRGDLRRLAAPSVATHYRAGVDLGGVLAVALSQSGGTGEIVETLRWAAACAATLPGPDLPEALVPLALIVPGQLVVEALARSLDFDPDRPVGLSKVTQTSGAVRAAPGGEDSGR